MPKQKVLILEDHRLDAQLVKRKLERSSYGFRCTWVAQQEQYLEALRRETFQCVVSDYGFPRYDGERALQDLKALQPETPFIIVSGTLGEERAVQIVKAGAFDFVLKDSLERLPISVHNAIQEKYEKQERLKAQRALLAAQKKWRSLVENSNDVILVLDEQARMQSINHFPNSFADAESCRQALKEHKPIYDLFPPSEAFRLSMTLRQIRQAGKSGTIEICGKQETTFTCTCIPIKDEQGSYAGAIILLKDVSIERRYQRKLKDTLQKLAASNKELAQFAYVSSHDMRTPIINLQGLTDLMEQKGYVHEEGTMMFDQIKRSIQRMRAVSQRINELLNVKRELDNYLPTTCVFQDVLEGVMAELNELIVQEQVGIMADFTDCPQFDYEPQQLARVLKNLLVNAITFRREEVSPRITIRSFIKNHKVYLDVADNGRGINLLAYRHKLFQLFQRFDLKDAGMGTGLYLVKMIVENLGGHIVLESEEGTGTHVRMSLGTLPAPSQAAPRENAELNARPASVASRRSPNQ